MRCERLGRAGLADQARSKVQGRAGLPLLRAPHCAPPPALVKCSRLVGWLVCKVKENGQTGPYLSLYRLLHGLFAVDVDLLVA